ncbi:hypothetical protein [Kosakonia radicincitans]|uniref:hypothetical protein n=1 Tax=Kosakonia radicincitans TaxID=283686 RepID=UPI0031D14DC8
MTQEEKVIYLVEKTCTLIAGRLANANCKLSPADAIEQHFENTYKALASELKKGYVSQSAK